MEAAQLVVKLLHYFGLLLEPAITNGLFLKSETGMSISSIHVQYHNISTLQPQRVGSANIVHELIIIMYNYRNH